MTTEEFSNEFDTLVSSYRRFKDFDDKEILDSIEFDEYEKSLFLTKAQEQLVISYYNGKNVTVDSFEKTEEIRRYLSSLVKTKITPIIRGYYQNPHFYTDENHTEVIPADTNAVYIDIPSGGSYKYENGSYSRIDDGYISNTSIDVPLPNKLWFITYESANLASSDKCLDDREIEVVPTTQDAYYRTKENPFKTTGPRRAFRLDVSGDKVELVSKYTIGRYLVRYVERPDPIVLTELPEAVSINGVSTPQTCSLIDSLHRPILELAVTLALRSKGIDLNK